MPLTMDIAANRFPSLAALLPAAVDAALDATATVIETDASENCPVRTGAMKASIRKEQTAEGYEVSVQKEEALAGEKTYALFVDSGTIHMQSEPFFTNACKAGETALAAMTIPGLT